MNYHKLKPPKLLSSEFFFDPEWEEEFQKFRLKDVPKLTRITAIQTIFIVILTYLLVNFNGPYATGFEVVFLGHMALMALLSGLHFYSSYYVRQYPRATLNIILCGSLLYVGVIVSTIKHFPVRYHHVVFNIFLIVIISNYLNLPLRLGQHLLLGISTFVVTVLSGIADSMLLTEIRFIRTALFVYGYGVNAIGFMVAYFVEFHHRQSFYFEQIATMEQSRVESLIQNILPPPVAERLKGGETTIAEDCTSATVMFADIVGFTEMSSQLHAGQLVTRLNEIFSKFDQITIQHGAEKIKTIGDCFMAAAGVPQACDDHAERMVRVAMAIQEEIRHFRRPDGSPMQLRIGIHSGPVTSGVIGINRFIFDLWGDTVNVASRLETTAQPGSIVISHETYELLGPDLQRVFDGGGRVELRGRGIFSVHTQKAA